MKAHIDDTSGNDFRFAFRCQPNKNTKTTTAKVRTDYFGRALTEGLIICE